MAQLAVSMAVILLIALVFGGIHGSVIKPRSVDSIIDGRGIPNQIISAKAGIDVEQCMIACKSGVTAMIGFCQLIPQSDVRNACSTISQYAGSAPGAILCPAFCNQSFG